MVAVPNFSCVGLVGLDGAIADAFNFFLETFLAAKSCSPVLHDLLDVLLVESALARFGDV